MSTDLYQYGWPLSRREEVINELVLRSHQFHRELYRGKYRELPIIEVPISLPVYRIENIRTKSMHIEWLAINRDKGQDFFTQDPGSIETQEVQHNLLNELVDKENLRKTFEKEGEQQTLPLICSDDGIVVNGNRRLCAWRNLYYSSPDKYKHFQTIKIAVLPDHDAQGMYDLEVALQIKKDMKAEYVWHTIAADCKEQATKYFLDFDEIAKKQGKKEDEIRTLVECYDYAADYLISIGKEGQWSEVDKDFFAFKQIVAARKGLPNPGDKELFREITKSILEVPAKGERLYSKIPKVAKHISRISKKLEERFDISIDDQIDPNDPLATEEDNLDIRGAIIASKLMAIDEPDRVVEVVDSVLQACEEEELEKTKKTFVLSQVLKAATALQSAVSTLDDIMEKEGVAKQLVSIEGSVNLIKGWLQQ